MTIYVDDIMATCIHPDAIDWLHQQLEKIYPIVSIHKGTTHSYLGQTFDFSAKGKVKITMGGYVNDLLSLYPPGATAALSGVTMQTLRVKNHFIEFTRWGQ